MPAGFVTVLTGVLYAPVRFFLDFLRPEDTDPRYVGLTFAQWSSILAFGAAVYAASRILRSGAPADIVAATSREAQKRLRRLLQEEEAAQQKQGANKVAEVERQKAAIARARAERDREDAEIAEAEAAERAKASLAGKSAARGTNAGGGGGIDEEGDTELVAQPELMVGSSGNNAASTPSGGNKAGGNKAGANRSGGNKAGANRSASHKSGGHKSPGNKNRKR
jgi:hypothetical protein